MKPLKNPRLFIAGSVKATAMSNNPADSISIPESEQPLDLEQLLAIGEVSETDIEQAVQKWQEQSLIDYREILNAEPEN